MELQTARKLVRYGNHSYKLKDTKLKIEEKK